jgi:hypothetical protein
MNVAQLQNTTGIGDSRLRIEWTDEYVESRSTWNDEFETVDVSARLRDGRVVCHTFEAHPSTIEDTNTFLRYALSELGTIGARDIVHLWAIDGNADTIGEWARD